MNGNAKNEVEQIRKFEERFSLLGEFFFLGVVTIREDTRGFIRNQFNQQLIIWPCKYDPQAILLLILDQTLGYVRKQDRGKIFSRRKRLIGL